jgi:hypothetical protein
MSLLKMCDIRSKQFHYFRQKHGRRTGRRTAGSNLHSLYFFVYLVQRLEYHTPRPVSKFSFLTLLKINYFVF